MSSKSNISCLIPHGGMKEIADKLGITKQAVSMALKGGRPSHPAVRMALAMARESGAIEAAQTLAALPVIAQAA